MDIARALGVNPSMKVEVQGTSVVLRFMEYYATAWDQLQAKTRENHAGVLYP